jgi:hypothetical protein
MARMQPTTIVRCVLLGLVAATVTLWRPPSAEACSCGGGPLSTSAAARRAEIVFVGTVARIDRPKSISHSRQNADGTVRVTVGRTSEPALVVFEVAHVFKGPSAAQIAVAHDEGSCGHQFSNGERWLIYGREGIGGVTPDECSRTRLASGADEDLLYLRSAEARRLQGIIYGDVHRRRNGPGGPALSALFEPLQVTAANATTRFVTTTDRWGPFELVLPPGAYQVWVERAGKPVSARSAVHVERGDETRLHLIAEYPDLEK